MPSHKSKGNELNEIFVQTLQIKFSMIKFDADAEPGEINDPTVEVLVTDKVEVICNKLGLDKASLKLNKQMREVGLNEIVGDIFEAEDTITIIRSEGHRKVKGSNIKNLLKEEVRFVILNTLKNEPIFVPLGAEKAVNFGFWNFSNKMEIYRYCS